MTIQEYLADDDRTYLYIGTIWGDEEMSNRGRDIAVQLHDLGYGTVEIVETPQADGFYITPRNRGNRTRYISYKNGPFIEEIVLKFQD